MSPGVDVYPGDIVDVAEHLVRRLLDSGRAKPVQDQPIEHRDPQPIENRDPKPKEKR